MIFNVGQKLFLSILSRDTLYIHQVYAAITYPTIVRLKVTVRRATVPF